MRTDHLDVASTDSSNPDLISSSAEEGCEGRAERQFTTTGETSCHSDHVLLSNETLNETLRMLVSESSCKSAHFCVSVKSNDPLVCLIGFEQSVSVGLPCRNLVSLFVVGWSDGDVDWVDSWIFSFGRRESLVFDVLMLDAILESFNAGIKLVADILAMPVEFAFDILSKSFSFLSLADDCSWFSSLSLGLLQSLD